MRSPRKISPAFSLLEVFASVAVLLILLSIIAQLVNSASSLTGVSNKAQQADLKARQLFGRMSLDLGKMLKRPDLDYVFQKNTGDDQIAFFSAVDGYYDPNAESGAISLIAYRVATASNGYKNIERMGKGLSWLQDASGQSSPLYLPNRIQDIWPSAASATDPDSDYEEAASGAIRFEYYFQLKSGELSENPWDASLGHSSIEGFQDVSALVVVVAVVDPIVRNRLTPAELDQLSAQFEDFAAGLKTGELERKWQEKVNASEVQRKGGGAVRIHSRIFPINS